MSEEKQCRCGQPAHPLYGSTCEDCFAERQSGSGSQAGGRSFMDRRMKTDKGWSLLIQKTQFYNHRKP